MLRQAQKRVMARHNLVHRNQITRLGLDYEVRAEITNITIEWFLLYVLGVLGVTGIFVLIVIWMKWAATPV